jgi:hypothetical protein
MKVTFKSTPSNYFKEKYGLKPNTFRKADFRDIRFQALMERTPNVIEIVNSESGESFTRYINDITFWDGYVIISWEHRG